MIAFMLFGTIPLIPYFVGYGGRKDNETQYLWTMAIGGVQLFILGYVKALLIGMPLLRKFVAAL